MKTSRLDNQIRLRIDLVEFVALRSRDPNETKVELEMEIF